MKNGRNTSCTPELTIQICEDLRSGLHIETACEKNRVCKATFHGWKKRGLTGEQPFLDFLNAVDSAEADLEKRLTDDWLAASQDVFAERDGREELIKKGDWRAAESFLKRRKPSRYGENLHNAHLNQSAANLSDIDQLKDMAKQVMSKITTGEMPIDPGSQLIKCIDDRIRLLSGTDYEQRMADIEKKIGIG